MGKVKDVNNGEDEGRKMKRHYIASFMRGAQKANNPSKKHNEMEDFWVNGRQ